VGAIALQARTSVEALLTLETEAPSVETGEELMVRATLKKFIAASAFAALAPSLAHSHGIAGNRYFVGALTFDGIFIILASSLLFNAASLAQTPMEWTQCLGLEGPSVDTVINGCTAVIQSGREPPDRLATAFDNRGVAFRLKAEYDRAMQDYEQAIRLNPGNANAYNNRGIIYRIKGEYAHAIADYDEAIWLKNGDFPAAYYNRALAYSDIGEYEHSLRDFDVVMRFNPKNALALYARGLTLLKKGDTEAGKDEINAAKAINPNVAAQFDHSESPSR
jgi:tetratricopeptide (TPR) repeat protein